MKSIEVHNEQLKKLLSDYDSELESNGYSDWSQMVIQKEPGRDTPVRSGIFRFTWIIMSCQITIPL